MFHIPALTASCSFWMLLKSRGSTAVETGETTNICIHLGKGHSGKGFIPILPIFSSSRAVLKSTVQRQKAPAAQLCWGHTEGQNPHCFRRVGCEALLGLQEDTFIVMLATPMVFPQDFSQDLDQLRQTSRQQSAEEKAGIKEGGWRKWPGVFVILLRVLVQLCAPSTGLHPENILGFSSKRGGKKCISF